MRERDIPTASSPEALAACLDHLRTEAEEAGFIEASLFLDLAILSIRRDRRQAPPSRHN